MKAALMQGVVLSWKIDLCYLHFQHKLFVEMGKVIDLRSVKIKMYTCCVDGDSTLLNTVVGGPDRSGRRTR